MSRRCSLSPVTSRPRRALMAYYNILLSCGLFGLSRSVAGFDFCPDGEFRSENQLGKETPTPLALTGLHLKCDPSCLAVEVGEAMGWLPEPWPARLLPQRAHAAVFCHIPLIPQSPLLPPSWHMYAGWEKVEIDPGHYQQNRHPHRWCSRPFPVALVQSMFFLLFPSL